MLPAKSYTSPPYRYRPISSFAKMNIECNPIWQECSPLPSSSTQAPPKLDSVISSVKEFISTSQPTCSTGYPLWILFLIWLTTESGVVVIDWIIHQFKIRRIMEFPEFMNSLPPSGKLLLFVLISIQHLTYYLISVCATVRNIHRERQRETVPMDPYEQV